MSSMRQRAERAESVSVTICNIVDRLRLKFEIQRNVNFTGDYVVQQFIYAKEDLAKAIYEGNPPPADASKMGGERERMLDEAFKEEQDRRDNQAWAEMEQKS